MPPGSGDVTVNGRHVHDMSWPPHEVGALLESRSIHPGRSARAHLQMLARTNSIPGARVDEVLEMTGLTSISRRRAGTFSLGMTQRLGMAAALLGDREVLLFDEPVNGLDPDGVRWVRNLLKSLAREGRKAFVFSHLMAEMALTADEVIIISAGRRAPSRQDPPVGAAGRACAAVRRQALICPEVFAPRRAR